MKVLSYISFGKSIKDVIFWVKSPLFQYCNFIKLFSRSSLLRVIITWIFWSSPIYASMHSVNGPLKVIVNIRTTRSLYFWLKLEQLALWTKTATTIKKKYVNEHRCTFQNSHIQNSFQVKKGFVELVTCSMYQTLGLRSEIHMYLEHIRKAHRKLSSGLWKKSQKMRFCQNIPTWF